MSVGEGTLIYRSDKREILTTSFKAFGQELPDTSLKVFFGSLYNEFNLPILVKAKFNLTVKLVTLLTSMLQLQKLFEFQKTQFYQK